MTSLEDPTRKEAYERKRTLNQSSWVGRELNVKAVNVTWACASAVVRSSEITGSALLMVKGINRSSCERLTAVFRRVPKHDIEIELTRRAIGRPEIRDVTRQAQIE